MDETWQPKYSISAALARRLMEIDAAQAQLIFQSIQADALRAISDPTPEQAAILKLTQCRMSPGKVQDFVVKLEKLANEFNDAEEETSDEMFALALMLYPISAHQNG